MRQDIVLKVESSQFFFFLLPPLLAMTPRAYLDRKTRKPTISTREQMEAPMARPSQPPTRAKLWKIHYGFEIKYTYERGHELVV